MIGRARRDIVVLAARERRASARVALASTRLERAKARFLANPVNLLLPFVAGTLGGALALYRTPPDKRGRRAREGVSWSSLLKTASTLWGLSLPLREAFEASRAERDARSDVPPPVTRERSVPASGTTAPRVPTSPAPSPPARAGAPPRRSQPVPPA